jgi:hypothetical protein
LYLSEEYNVAGHLCPCGCGNKVITPLGSTEWSYVIRNNKITLYPSLGNWQLPCRSHYWIRNGKIEWSYQWTDEQIEKGKRNEEVFRRKHFGKDKREKKRKNLLKVILMKMGRK